MFNKIQEEYLIRRLNRNEVVLFLGAGFSASATNQLDEHLPMGNQLGKKMFQFMLPSETFVEDGTSLQDMYQALLTSGISYPQISEFLRANLTVKTTPDFYKYLTYPFWYKIYTINIDNLINKIYDRFGDQQVDNIVYPTGIYKERDQILEKLQIIYLHGKINGRAEWSPEDIIFSRAQYANVGIKLQPLYFQFINDYAVSPTIFIGTSLDEQLFYQYIATRQSISKNVAENRPKSFLIVPSISVVKEKVLKSQHNIEVIKATTEQFLEWIGSKSAQLLSKEELIKKLIPTFDKLINNVKFKEEYSHSVKEFSQSFQQVSSSKKFPPKKKNFLLGTTPTWADIYYNLDASRKLTGELFLKVEDYFTEDNSIRCIAILGSAGSGKSTVLKRVCFNLVNAGRTVFFSHSESLPRDIDLIETLQMLKERVIIAIDNAELVLRQLIKIAQELNKIKFPPIFILASRTNVFDRISSKYEPLINLEEFEMKNLDRDEIVDVLDKLKENNLLGNLKGLSQDQRIKEFENKAKKQILVAMREATEGKDFEAIMKSEFQEIDSEEGRILCLCVSLATEAGFTITKQDFASFSSKAPSEALDILERNLKGLVLKVGVKDDRLMLRHRLIANFLIESCSNPEMLKQAYIRVLSSLANEINVSKFNSRKFMLYKEIINHYMVYRRFAKNINKAREVYEYLSDFFNDDYHFWLQYGSLELEGVGGSLELAENYLNQAKSIKEKSSFVKNALASLYYKKALITATKTESDTLKEKADGILLDLLRDKYNTDPYSFHIYGKGNYNWIIQWLKGSEKVREALYGLKKIIEVGCDLFPSNKRLAELKDIISKAILMTAVNSKEVRYPIIISELEI